MQLLSTACDSDNDNAQKHHIMPGCRHDAMHQWYITITAVATIVTSSSARAVTLMRFLHTHMLMLPRCPYVCLPADGASPPTVVLTDLRSTNGTRVGRAYASPGSCTCMSMVLPPHC